jgi:hypothetical protein
LISLFCFSSCEKIYKYRIDWNVLGDFDDSTITLNFSNEKHGRLNEYTLRPNNTKAISVVEGSSLVGIEFTKEIQCKVYPELQEIANAGTIEVYLYNPKIKKNSENQHEMEKYDGINIYFVRIPKEGKCYYTFSKDNILVPTEPKKYTSLDDIEKTLDIEDFTYLEKFERDVTGNILPGYIVRSKYDNKYVWLKTIFEW